MSVTQTIDREEYIFEKNVEIPLKPGKYGSVIRANVYRPKGEGKFPVLATYGPCKCWPQPSAQRLLTLAQMAKTFLTKSTFHHAKYVPKDSNVVNHYLQLPSQVIRRRKSKAEVRRFGVGGAGSAVLDVAWLRHCACR